MYRKRIKLKKTFIAAFLLIVLVMSLAVGIVPAVAQPSSIAINEVMANPARVSDNNGEWVELYNPTTADIDINGWTIKDDYLDSHVIDNGEPLLVPAGGYLVLGNNDNPSENGGVNVAYSYYNPDRFTNSFHLANQGDEVVIVDLTDTVVDRCTYIRSWTGVSWSLKNAALDNTYINMNSSLSWYLSNAIYGVGDRGTPGQRNGYADDLTNETIDEVGDLVDNGELDSGQGKALSSILEVALGKIEEDNTSTATNQLNAAIKKIKAWMKSGKISSEDGQALIDAINNILAAL
jgi:hypothetical protein